MRRRSDRNSAPLGGTGPRDWTPPGWDLPYRPAQQQHRRRALAVLGAAIGVAVIITLLVNGSDGGGPAHAPIVAAPSGATPSGTAATDAEVVGLTEATSVGSCFDAQVTTRQVIQVTFVSCHTTHDYELVAHEQATGADDRYPADSYWDGPVAARCYQDVRSYTGQPRTRWPAALNSDDFIPRRQGWAAGDRSVYCVAQYLPRAVGTVRHLRPSRQRAIAPGGGPSTSVQRSAAPTAAQPAAPAQVTLAGRLVVVTAGTDVCLAITYGRGTDAVLQSGTPGLSWLAATTSDGDADDARSGISSGAQPSVDRILVHAGAPARVTGTYQTMPTPSCGTNRVFAFTAVRT